MKIYVCICGQLLGACGCLGNSNYSVGQCEAITHSSSVQCLGFFIRRPCWTNSITSGPLRPGYGVDAAR